SHLEYRVPGTGEARRWIEGKGQVLFEEGRPVRMVGICSDVTRRKQAEELLSRQARAQAAVAALGQKALAVPDLPALMSEAVHTLAGVLGVEYCKLVELLPGDRELLLRAGVGWREGLVGHATGGPGLDAQAGYTLLSGGPVVVEDLGTEARFRAPPLLREHGVVSGMSCRIAGPAGQPYGVLGVHTARPRRFAGEDVHFL